MCPGAVGVCAASDNTAPALQLCGVPHLERHALLDHRLRAQRRQVRHSLHPLCLYVALLARTSVAKHNTLVQTGGD